MTLRKVSFMIVKSHAPLNFRQHCVLLYVSLSKVRYCFHKMRDEKQLINLYNVSIGFVNHFKILWHFCYRVTSISIKLSCLHLNSLLSDSLQQTFRNLVLSRSDNFHFRIRFSNFSNLSLTIQYLLIINYNYIIIMELILHLWNFL